MSTSEEPDPFSIGNETFKLTDIVDRAPRDCLVLSFFFSFTIPILLAIIGYGIAILAPHTTGFRITIWIIGFLILLHQCIDTFKVPVKVRFMIARAELGWLGPILVVIVHACLFTAAAGLWAIARSK